MQDGFLTGKNVNKLKDKKLLLVMSTSKSQKHYRSILWESIDKDILKTMPRNSEGILSGDRHNINPSLNPMTQFT